MKKTKDLLPIVGLFEDKFLLASGEVLDIFQIRTKDLKNIDDVDIDMDNAKWQKYFKLSSISVKIISMNFPCHYQGGKDFIAHKLEKTLTEEKRHFLEKQYLTLEWLEKNTSSKAFFLEIFYPEKKVIEEEYAKLKAILGFSSFGLLEEISLQKKKDILYKLHNKSAFMV